MQQNRREEGPHQSAFTLIEVVVVIAIGAALLAAILVFVPTLQKNRRDAQRKENLAKIAHVMNMYYSDTGSYLSVAAQNPTLQTMMCNAGISDAFGAGCITNFTLAGGGSCPANGTYALHPNVNRYWIVAPTQTVSGVTVCVGLEGDAASHFIATFKG